MVIIWFYRIMTIIEIAWITLDTASKSAKAITAAGKDKTAKKIPFVEVKS